MTKPTIVCVPGAWHTPQIYYKVFSILNTHGYPTVGLALPSVGATPAHANFDGDVKAIRDCVTALVDEGKDVVLVTHSYSGMPGAEAPVGLGKKERLAAGLEGGVVRLVFVAGFAMAEGFMPTAGGAQFSEWIDVDAEKGILTVSSENAKSVFYNDMSAEEGEAWASRLEHQSAGVFTSTTSYAAWRYIPSTYVVANEDKTFFTPEMVDFIIENARKIEPTALDVVERCDAGHCLMISRPEWLADVLRRAAGESF